MKTQFEQPQQAKYLLEEAYKASPFRELRVVAETKPRNIKDGIDMNSIPKAISLAATSIVFDFMTRSSRVSREDVCTPHVRTDIDTRPPDVVPKISKKWTVFEKVSHNTTHTLRYVLYHCKSAD